MYILTPYKQDFFYFKMCGRFTLYFFPDAEREFEERFGIPFPTPAYPPSYNIAPYRDIPVVVNDWENKTQIRPMWWQLIPYWEKEFKT
ncbi:MAG: hypothetical protein GWN00_13925, partial [Aliifodinibius sp.]|nr:SOS response-associated peptidase [candidate division KSB1 bacterium]NIT57283.1 SOS response-associated peptidase [Fodinibius sp.]NIV12223.1 hypothetical protein [Fodinibius sp.]NIY25865.1 hypothetical protein [Fodinibius sp.]